jgi:hypothetical protein
MLIRPEIVTRGAQMLKPWREATDFTKMFLILEWSGTMGGLTIYEISVILYPTEIFNNGAPINKAVNKTKNLRQHIRHHKINDMLIPFAMHKLVQLPKGSKKEWLTLNVTEKDDWIEICKRMSTVIQGYKNTMEKFDKLLDVGIAERNARIRKYLDRAQSVLKASPRIRVPTKKRRKRK